MRDTGRTIHNRIFAGSFSHQLTVHEKKSLRDRSGLFLKLVFSLIAVAFHKVVGFAKTSKFVDDVGVAIECSEGSALYNAAGDLFRSKRCYRKGGPGSFLLNRYRFVRIV